MEMLNPRVDFAFKKLFGSEGNKDILKALINAIVSTEDQVADIVLLNPYNGKDYPNDKISILDIKAMDKCGRYYNIEMQITDQVYYNQRALYYWAKLYSSQLQSGDIFKDLKKTISINILNFNYFEQEPNYHTVFKVLNVGLGSHRSYFDDLELHFIELNKIDEDLNHIKTALDRWVNFLRKAHRYDLEHLPPELTQEPAIQKAFTTLAHLYMNTEEREIYEARLKWLRDEAAALEKRGQKSFNAGFPEGIQQGIERSIERGIEQGKVEQKLAIAKNLLLLGELSVEAIAQVTGFTTAEIAKFKEL
jgi:predicted transposase/invertase (TIGR01784 family)